MVVAEVAYNHLSPAVKAKCDALIAVPLSFSSTASTNFITAASWADDFKSQLGTGTSHYIDLPLCISGYLGGNCADGSSTNNAPPAVPNVVTALNQYIAVLQNPNATLTDQATALRYVIHFVGDIQQPLHASNGISTSHPTPSGDGGGNSFSLKGTFSELHALWDSGGGYLNDSGISRPMQASGYAIISNKVADVEATYPYTPNIGTIPDPMTWATDSFYYAQTVAYVGITEGGTPTTSYLNSASATSKQRMAAGGHRLADLLMTIFVTNAASFTASQTNGIAPLSVTFTDTSTGGITNRFWNFGDGKTTNFTAATNPTHTYTAGTYNVTLTVSGSVGSSTNAKPNYIKVVSCTPPTALVTGGQTICPGGSATIQAALTGTGPWNVTWLDGTGGTNYLQNGVATSTASRTVSPSSTTAYAVAAVSDASGCSGGTSSGSAIVTVNQTPATPSPANNGPICSGQTLNLFANTTADSYSWTGPNSFSSSAQNPMITNATTAATGTYNLTVTSNGCVSATGSTTATVNQIPAAPSGPAITTPSAGFCINAASAAALTVSGTADTNVTVQIFANATLIGATTADGVGNWSTNLNFIAQADGPMSLTAVAMIPCNSSAPSPAVNGTKDTTAPSFAGLDAATPAIESATLTWSAAVDSNAVTYQVFQSLTSGTENFGVPTLTTNSLSVSIAPLYPGSNSPITYFFVVRATDSCGNTDTNTVEKSLQPLLDPNKSQVGDGIPNGWKQQYGLNPFDPSVAAGDADGDGCNNLCEFLSGTDPTSSASSFRITSVATTGSDVAITWAAGLGRTNVLQSSAGLADGSYGTNFTDISPMIVLPAGGGDTTTNYIDPGAATNAPSQYYRVRLQP